jgi:Flp pilus assembly protein TadG
MPEGADRNGSALSSRGGRHRERRFRSQRSQALVEFSLVAPLFLLILFAAVDIGRLLYAYTAISSAARDGARTASLQVHSPRSSVRAAACI